MTDEDDVCIVRLMLVQLSQISVPPNIWKENSSEEEIDPVMFRVINDYW